MDIKIARPLHDALLAAAAQTPDAEICGLVFGDSTSIASFDILDNIASRIDTEFEIDPSALIAAHKASRAGGPRLIGHFHSHPNGVCRPSVRDAAESGGDGALWLIIAGGNMGAWRATALGVLNPVGLEIAN